MKNYSECVVEQNAQARDQRMAFAPHREQVMRLVDAARHLALEGELLDHGRFCAFGAGNCNDVDLEQLTRDFNQVTLVDLDLDALEQAVVNLGESQREQVKLIACDLCGLVPFFDQPTGKRSDIEPQRLIHALKGHGLPELQYYDVIVSTCVLTQMVAFAAELISDTHPHFQDVVQAIQSTHLKHMLESLRPDGIGILLTDVVSADQLADVASCPEELLPLALRKAIEQGVVFPGANPVELCHSLGQPPFASMVRDVTLVAPWRWLAGQSERLVAAVRFQRA